MDIPVVTMILRSGWIARIILMILAFFSILSWAVIFNRLLFLKSLQKHNRSFLKKFRDARNLNGLSSAVDPAASFSYLGRAAAAEMQRIIEDAQSHRGVKDWGFFLQNQFSIADEHLESELSVRTALLDRGLVLLAIISSVAPFLGLLGTVWGIMNSFYEIGNQGSASLPVVAPGIAEALITTIVGLAVAVPAVFFYNFLLHRVTRLEEEIQDFKETCLARLKRELFSMLYRDQH